jgi:putative OPT family oligopeptide transporter
MMLVGAMVVSGLVHFITLYLGVEDWHLFEQLGLPEYLNGTWYLSLMTIGVAFIAGRGGLAFIIGGFVCYWVLAPLLDLTNSFPVDTAGAAITDPNQLRLMLFRPTGIGMLIGGAVVGVLFALPLIKSAIKSMQSAAKKDSAMSKDELPIKMLYFAVVGAAILLGVMAVTSAEEVGIVRGLMMAVLGTLWIWMAGIILSEAIGRTNWSPLSGMTLIAVTLLIMITQTFGGMDTGQAIVAAVTVGAATCVAMSQATDLMLDLKTGYLVGATPKQQQLGQFFGAWLGPIVIIILIFTLDKAFGLGGDEFPAPQGQALASMVQGITGGDIPTEKYVAGAMLGGLLSLLQAGLGITVGLGFYLPFNIVLTYSLGTLLREVTDRTKGKSWSDSKGIPIAAGLIVGEALVGVGNAVYVIMSAG